MTVENVCHSGWTKGRSWECVHVQAVIMYKPDERAKMKAN